MKATFIKPLGGSTITITAEVADAKELIATMTDLSFIDRIPAKCNECDGPNLTLTHRANKGYDFYEATCTKCGARLKIGESKAGPLFVRYGTTFTKYQADNNTTATDAPFNPEDI